MKIVLITLFLFTITARSEEGHVDDESNGVGKGKGIVYANEAEGFTLSKEAAAKFSFAVQRLVGKQQWKIPKTAILKSKDEINLYKFSNSLIKRIDFEMVKEEGDFIWIKSKSLSEGDVVITTNIGFVRLAELSAFEGSEVGHSH